MGKKLTSLFAALVIATSIIILPSVLTPTAAAACAGATITFHDDPNQTQTLGEQDLVRCYSQGNIPDFRSIPYTDVNGNVGPWCSSSLIGHSDWDDCISSFKFVGSCHYGFILYIDYNYQSVEFNKWGNYTFNGGLGYEDQASSFKFQYRTVCPSAPAP